MTRFELNLSILYDCFTHIARTEAMHSQIASLCIVMLYRGDPDIDADTCTIP